MKRVLVLFAVLILTSAAVSPASAAENRKGAFIGGSFGTVDGETDESNIPDADCGPLGCNVSVDDDTWKLFGGYRFGKWAAFEMAWQDFGKLEATVSQDATDVSLEADGLSLWARGNLPLGPVDLFAKLGALWWDAEYRRAEQTQNFSQSDSGLNIGAGLGILINIKRFGIRIEAEGYDVDDLNSFVAYTAGVQWRFGGN